MNKLSPDRRPCMVNYKIHVVSSCIPHLKSAIEMVFDDIAYSMEQNREIKVVTHSLITPPLTSDPSTGSVLRLKHASGNEQGFTKLPFPLDLEATISFVLAFLRTAEYGEQPDHDGSNSPGFEVSNDGSGIWSGHCLRVEAVWAMHGK